MMSISSISGQQHARGHIDSALDESQPGMRVVLDDDSSRADRVSARCTATGPDGGSSLPFATIALRTDKPWVKCVIYGELQLW
jgi:hypothetical protein